jgi:signal transduction histidine kinase
MTYREESLRRLAWAVYGLSIVGLGVSLYLDSASGQHGDVLFGVVVFTIPTVGFIVLTRRPRTILGWLMLSMGVAFALPLESYANYALTGPLAPLPGGAIALALSQPIWVPFIGISGYLLLLFPDGHVPTPRWRWFSWMCGIGLVVLSLVIIFSPGTFEDSGYPNITNPLGLEWLGPWAFVTVVFAPLIVVGGAVGVFRRLRRTTDQVQRQQLRWLAWSAALIAGSYVLAFFPQLLGAPAGSQWENWLSTLAVFSFILIPITIGLAVLRYRLYDIDVVIRKTVVVAVLVVFVAIVYVALVAAIGVFVGTRYSNVASGIAAAVVALAFQPVRRWARRAADRLVYGTRATPYEVLTEFGENLADTYGAEDVLPRLARVLGEGVGAQRARVWLDSGASRRIVATWAADDDGGADARRDDDDLVEEVRHQGETLGAMSVLMPANDPIDEPRTQLVTDLAAQAGLVMRNARLVEDLRDSRRRLVAAQDVERRKLERNIHDGAQQQLVALAVKARLAQQFLTRDPDRATEVLAQIEAETQTALEDLRDLARGIYPPLLADKGLAAALEAQGARLPVAVTLHADGVGRYPQDIEAAAYFSCLEAMQNVAKYAQAHAVSLTLTRAGDRLVFVVRDDGVGFDPDAIGYGTGLQGIADRLAALGGSLTVTSAPGHGTTLTGSLPVPDEDARVVEPERGSRSRVIQPSPS